MRLGLHSPFLHLTIVEGNTKAVRFSKFHKSKTLQIPKSGGLDKLIYLGLCLNKNNNNVLKLEQLWTDFSKKMVIHAINS